MSGLNRYDGNEFKVFKHDAKNPASIDDHYIVRITELPDAKLLVVTRYRLNIYDPATEKFDHQTAAYSDNV